MAFKGRISSSAPMSGELSGNVAVSGTLGGEKQVSGNLSGSETLSGGLDNGAKLTGFLSKSGSSTSGGTLNYNELYNKPSINDVTLIGNKTGSELNLQEQMDAITNLEISNMMS